MQLENKRVIVTGATGGMGSVICQFMIREGAQIAAFDINDELGARLESSFNGELKYYNCNVADRADVFQKVMQASEWLGGVDTLVHLAAIHPNKFAEEWTEADLKKTTQINYFGTVFIDQAVCEQMKNNENGGSIINFASPDASMGAEMGAIYATSKGAVISWTRTIAMEWARKYKIRSNSVLPTAKTPLYQEFLDRLTPEQMADHKRYLKERIPLTGELGDPEDIANYMVFLASDGAKFVNGALIQIDGGQCMLRG